MIVSDDEERYSDDYDDFDSDDDDEYFEEQFRAEARFWASEADENFRSYRIALKSGEGGIANHYYDEVKYCRKCMKEANDTAAEIAFDRNNEGRTVDVIDLHHLFVCEAIAKLTDRVNYAIKWKNMSELTVIVGRGHHSEDGPKLQTAVANFALKRNIRYGFDPLNPGRMWLWLEDASEIRLQENESEHSDSSMYLYNRANEVPLSEYITQSQHKKQRSKNRKNKLRKKQEARDRPDEVSTKAHSPLNVNRTPNLKQKKMKCNTQQASDHSNNMPSSVKTSQIQQNNSTYIPQYANGDLGQPSNRRSTTQRTTDDRRNEVKFIFLYVLFVLVGLMFVAKLCGF